MKVTTKRISFMLLCVACALLMVLGASMPGAGIALGSAVSETATASGNYYYDNLKDATGNDYALAKTFYNALDEMNTNGDFKDGLVQYSLANILTSDQIEAWVTGGNITIPKAFSAARDSYFYDHPELFYVDLYKLTISAGRTSGVYSAYIDCGLEPNCYVDGGTLTNAEQVESAITAYNLKIEEIAEYAQEVADKDNYGILQDKLLADSVNEYIAKNVEYDYEAFTDSSATGSYTKPYMGNAYGALILQKCVCSGYSFAYKAVLDKLGIPCVIVSGNSIKKATDGSAIDTGEAHSWNYVKLTTPIDDADSQAVVALADETPSAWFAYDVTWNSNCENKNSYNAMSAFITSRNHSLNTVISSSGYQMPYPDLSMINYGNTTIDNEFMHSYVYEPDSDKKDDYGNQLMTYKEYVSYKGKGAIALLKEGVHIIQRAYAFNSKTQQMYWTAWFDIGSALQTFWGVEEDNGNQTEMPNFYQSMYIQYAVTDLAPDLNYNPLDEMQQLAPSNIYYSLDNEELGKHTLFISEAYTNKTFGTYTSAPYVMKTTPKHTGQNFISESMAGSDGIMQDKYAFTIEVTYDEDLHILDTSKPIGIEFTSQFANIYKYAKLIPVNSNGDMVEIVDGNKLRFKFKPSLMYEHNMSLYSFYFSNVGSSKLVAGASGGTHMSNKVPNPVHYNFERQYTACNQILGGGRLWIDCCAQPTLVSNSDLAAMDFKDEDGNSTFSEQARSQMMLVAERASSETENAMLNTINKDFGIKSKDLKASETYDINLQICGKYPKIADGSYVKIALGFPEGYGPQDEGVVFKLYHRKHTGGNNYIIEEVPCVVTQFGIVATVTSFSPYMVAAVDASKVSATKTVYATIDGKGGTLSREDGKIRSLNPGESYTYSITPDEGYGLYRVMLNGEDVTSEVKDGKLTVSYANMLNNNEIVIQYISDVAKQRYDDNFELVEPVKVIVATNGNASIAVLGKDLPMNTVMPTSLNIGLVVGVSIAVAIVVAGIAVAVVLIMKRRKSAQQEA